MKCMMDLLAGYCQLANVFGHFVNWRGTFVSIDYQDKVAPDSSRFDPYSGIV
jgi:hypothetical protein